MDQIKPALSSAQLLGLKNDDVNDVLWHLNMDPDQYDVVFDVVVSDPPRIEFTVFDSWLRGLSETQTVVARRKELAPDPNSPIPYPPILAADTRRLDQLLMSDTIDQFRALRALEEHICYDKGKVTSFELAANQTIRTLDPTTRSFILER
jgi:hypothetical protein